MRRPLCCVQKGRLGQAETSISRPLSTAFFGAPLFFLPNASSSGAGRSEFRRWRVQGRDDLNTPQQMVDYLLDPEPPMISLSHLRLGVRRRRPSHFVDDGDNDDALGTPLLFLFSPSRKPFIFFFLISVDDFRTARRCSLCWGHGVLIFLTPRSPLTASATSEPFFLAMRTTSFNLCCVRGSGLSRIKRSARRGKVFDPNGSICR